MMRKRVEYLMSLLEDLEGMADEVVDMSVTVTDPVMVEIPIGDQIIEQEVEVGEVEAAVHVLEACRIAGIDHEFHAAIGWSERLLEKAQDEESLIKAVLHLVDQFFEPIATLDRLGFEAALRRLVEGMDEEGCVENEFQHVYAETTEKAKGGTP